MEEYIVSALKYRPLTFDSVVGQRALTATLKNAIASGKLAHAYLFCGPRGVGKTTCARIFAKTINCLSPHADGEACGECESCKAFQQQRSMNIHELDAASNNSVDDIRELITQVQIPPQIGRYKVFIIDEVHMLSTQAFNAFLKTLEEPPSYVIFILATTEKHKILPTILSRCQVYDFARMTVQNTIDHLQYVADKEGYTTEPDALNLIAQKADGGMRDALSIFDQMVSFTGGHLTYQNVSESLNVLSTDYYFRLVDHFLKNEVEPCMLLFNEVLNKGFDGGNFIGGLAAHLRNLLVSRDAQTLPLLEVSEQMKAQFQEQASRCKPAFLYRAIRLCNDCDQNYRTSRNKRLQVEICLIQAAQLTADEDVPGAGLGPAKFLKPLFNKQRQGIANASPAPSATGSSTPATTNTTSPAGQATIPATADATSTPSSPLPKRTFAQPDQPKIKTISMRGFGPSLSSGKSEPRPTIQNVGITSAPTQNATLQEPVTEESVRICWLQFAQSLSVDETATAQRMKAMTLSLKGNNVVEIMVNNEAVKHQMQQIMPRITAFMQQTLRNTTITLQISVIQAQEVQTHYNKRDLFVRMTEQNPSLKKFTELLELELL